ncbi:hypothetical protein FE773_07870 [Caminibacter mediatlanticus TB-2]|uniref:Lipoprotein LPP20-like domain-containing protein n=1 Tax=Caminibacter mediatlanticus TB-2 TaxID=391592 RepID=A0ABX5VDA7_9BACT|nr:LPP20 family lipoprotein [Caminibacter mediatlanticus]QCT95109.1 hypothetical protein FE773_07870 [Caminibacter mediatlanticus TB-2]
MKKFLFFAFIIFFIGCSSKSDVNKINSTCIIENQNAPSWICRPEDTKEYITAVGSAEKTNLGFSFQQTEAVAAARDALARRISVKVKNIFKRYESNTGVKGNLVSEKVVTNVSKQLSNLTLNDSKILNTWQSKNGTLYVLVGMPKANIKKAFYQSIKKYESQNEKANIEWNKLDKEINKEFE